MAQKFVGIDLGSHHIKVAVVSAGLRGVQLLDTFEEPVGPAPEAPEGGQPLDAFSHQLAVTFSALRARGLLGQTLGICLPARALSYRLLEFPFSDERRIAQTVGFEADGQFAQPIEELSHGHLVVPSNGDGGRALVVATPKQRLAEMREVFHRAGSELKVVTSGALALAQVGKVGKVDGHKGEQEHPVALMVDLGHNYTHFVAMGAKGPLAVRSVRRGGRQISNAIARAYHLSPEEAELSKHTDAFLPHRGLEDISSDQMEAGKVVAAALEPLLRELEHTRVWLRSTYDLDVAKVVLCGGGAGLRGLDAYLKEHLGLEVSQFSPHASGLKVPPGKRFVRFGAAIGAAYGTARRPLVQLHDSTVGDAGSGWIQERMVSIVAMGVAVMAFGAFDTIARVRAGDAQLAAYEDELAIATQKAFGEELNPQGVSKRIAATEGEDLTSKVPERGALEVLAMLTKATKPSDYVKPLAAGLDAAGLGGMGPDGMPLPGTPGATGVPFGPMGSIPTVGTLPGGPLAVGPTGVVVDPNAPLGPDAAPAALNPDGTPVVAEDAKAGPLPADAGILMVDELTIKMLDIRERKVTVKAEAKLGSTQDRFATAIEGITCISKVSKGKVRGQDRKTFTLEMDQDCYHKQTAASDAASGAEG